MNAKPSAESCLVCGSRWSWSSQWLPGFLAGLLATALIHLPGYGATNTVTTTSDSGAGSLRAAIVLANADASTPRVINFNIPGGGVQTITLASALPAVAKATTIDATTQPGYAGSPLVVLDGNSGNFDGLTVNAFFTGNPNNTSAVKGLCIINCGINGGTARNGLVLQDGDMVTVSGCNLGINAAGTTAARNTFAGVRIVLATVVIGGTNPADRCVISGNLGAGIDANTDSSSQASPVTIIGNYIGTAADGMSAVPNGGGGISALASVTYAPLTIGSGTAGGGNVISGNGSNGVRTARSATLSGNFIGLAADGATALGNTLNGVSIEGSVSMLGDGTQNRNVISANGGDGVRVSGDNSPGNRSSILGNYIGTDATGMLARGNGSNGVEVVVGSAAIGANVISANAGSGVRVASGDGNITTCKIGVNANTTAKLPNGGDGITIVNVPGLNIGNNTIGGNLGSGINITGGSATGITITGNLIGSDSGGTVNLGNGLYGIAITGGAQSETIGSTIANGSGMNLVVFNAQAGILTTGCNGLFFNRSFWNGGGAYTAQNVSIPPATVTSVVFPQPDLMTVSFTENGGAALANAFGRLFIYATGQPYPEMQNAIGSADFKCDLNGIYTGSAQFQLFGPAPANIANYVLLNPTNSPCAGNLSQPVSTSGSTPTVPVLISVGNNIESYFLGDPVSTFTGELYDSLPPDLGLDGPIPLVFQRYYAAFIKKDGFIAGKLGDGWLHNFEMTLTVTSSNIVYVMNNQGRAVWFTNSAGTFTLLGRQDVQFQLATNGSNYILADPRSQRLFTFDSTGKLISIADSHGNSHTLAYTGSQLSSVSDGLGRAFTFQYNGSGKLTNVTDGSRSVAFTQAGNNLVSARSPLGFVTIYSYDLANTNSGLMTNATRPFGNAPFTQTFDAQGRVATQTSAGSNVWGLNFSGAITTVTNPAGNVAQDTHATTGELSAYKDEAGLTLTVGSNSRGQRSLVTDRLGNSTGIGYHAPSGKPSALTNADGTLTLFNYSPRTNSGIVLYDVGQIVYPDGAVETFSYDGNGNMLTRTDRAGKVFGFSYNARGQVLTATNPLGGVVTFTYNTNGMPASRRDTDTGLTTFAYDSLNRLTNVIHPDATKLSATYDANDRLTSVTDERGNVTQFAYDANDRLTQITDANNQTMQFNYDTRDRLVQTIDRLGKASAVTYDQLDHVSSVTNRNGNVTRFTYDARRRLTAVIDPGNQVWNLGYDNEALLSTAANPLNQTNRLGRDQLGYETSATNALGQSASLVRDSMRRVTQTIDGILRTNRYAYDSRGLLTNATRPLIGGAGYQRNNLGQVSKITGLNGEQWNFSYTPMGRLQSLVDPLNRAATNLYDSRGRWQKTTFADSTTRSNSYDAAGNLTRRKYSAGPDLQYTYDSLNRLVTADNLAFSYDAEGRVTNTASSGVNYGASYDADGRLTNVTYHAGAFSVTYTYDTRDRLMQISDTLTGTTLNFSYDNAGRLIGLTRPNGVNGTYTYDAAGRLTRIQEGGTIDIQYTVDAAGEITGANFTAPLDPANFLAPANPVFGYDAAHQITNPGYGFDARGRQTASPGHSFNWDGASRLAGVDAVSLAYNGLSDILTRAAGGVTTRYFYNHAIGLSPIMTEKNDSNGQIQRYYVWTPGGQLLYLIDAANGNAVRFFHFDRVGSTLALTSSAGAVTDAYVYTPYGILLSRTGTSTQPFTFVGAFGIRADGSLYQMRARYYDPLTARFLSRDPAPPQLDDPRTLDPYPYALGNPARYVDMTGAAPEDHQVPAYSRKRQEDADELYRRLVNERDAQWERESHGGYKTLPDNGLIGTLSRPLSPEEENLRNEGLLKWSKAEQADRDAGDAHAGPLFGRLRPGDAAFDYRPGKTTLINGSTGGELNNNGFPSSPTVMNNLGSDSGGFSEGSLAGLREVFSGSPGIILYTGPFALECAAPGAYPGLFDIRCGEDAYDTAQTPAPITRYPKPGALAAQSAPNNDPWRIGGERDLEATRAYAREHPELYPK